MTTKWKAAKAAWHWPKDLSLKIALLQKTWWRVVVSMDSEGVEVRPKWHRVVEGMS